MTSPVLSFVIPAHNSVSVIEHTLASVARRLADVPTEIIVVENASTDGTPELLARLRVAWRAAPRLHVVSAARGLGHAVRAGIAVSSGRTVVVTADDLPFGFDDLEAAERLGLPAAGVLIGSKAHPGSVVDRSLARTVLTAGHRVLRRAVLGMRIKDPQGSLVLPGDWARAVASALREPGFLISTEIAYAADLAGVPVVEVPVRLRSATHRSRVRPSDVVAMGVGLVSMRGRRQELRAAARAAASAGRPTVPRPADGARGVEATC